MNSLLAAFLFAVLFACGLAVSLLPRRLELALGRALGRLAMHLAPSRRRVAEENMRRCLPELSPKGRARLLRENFEHYGVLALEILHMFSPISGHYRRYTARVARLEGFEHWKRAADRGKGVLFVSAHLANWEFAAGAAALKGIPITITTRYLKPKWLHRKMEATRLSTGVRALYQPRTLPGVLRALRANEAVTFVMDQYAPPPMGIWAVFFGAKVHTLAAVGSIAQRTGAAIITAKQRRTPDGIVHIVLEPEVDLGDAAGDPDKATQILVSRVEKWIREEPSQWLWVHRRFKNAVWPDSAAAVSSRAS
ncbi:MAG: hypothetical protein KGL04_08095 [Elusimicrobia bacterium]|nr:hypothetical protein [Elusimicrobiota bacterium]MDE2314119.1 hypothetical protein [Elusimicrobiota bacterium]